MRHMTNCRNKRLEKAVLAICHLLVKRYGSQKAKRSCSTNQYHCSLTSITSAGALCCNPSHRRIQKNVVMPFTCTILSYPDTST